MYGGVACEGEICVQWREARKRGEQPQKQKKQKESECGKGKNPGQNKLNYACGGRQENP